MLSKQLKLVFITGFLLASACAIAVFLIVDCVMEPYSSPKFCSSCHEMKDIYKSWEKSGHNINRSGVSVKCVSCHLPPVENYTSHITAKAWVGTRHILHHLFGGKYDAEELRKKVLLTLPGERCIHCHSNLLGLPGSSAVAIVHKTALRQPDSKYYACVACHDSLHSPPRKTPAPGRKIEPADNSFCYVCHINWKQEEFVVTHRLAGIACYDCHGNSEEHADDEEHIAAPGIMFPKDKANASCITDKCHPPGKMKEEIGHRPFYAGAPEQKYCTDCHGEHRLMKRKRRWDKITRKLIEKDGRIYDTP